MLRLTLWARVFSMFSWKSVPVSSITGKQVNGFSWNLQQRWGLKQGTICNIFGMLRSTPWIRGRFFYFLDPWLLVISWKTGERIFMIFFYETLGTTAEIINKTVSHLTSLFHGLPSRHDGVPVSNITVKGMNGISWNFQDMSIMAQETIWHILGMMRLNLWKQVSFFYFMGPCLLATSRLGGYSWNCQDMDTRSNWLDSFTPD